MTYSQGVRVVTTENASEPDELRELADPEFFAHWAKVRARLAVTRADSPEHAGIKRRYDSVAAEYQRRVARLAAW